MSYDKSIRFQCMDDCLHLKACRRLQKIANSKWLRLPRYCSAECTAYETKESFQAVDINQADYYDDFYDPEDFYLFLREHSEEVCRLIPGENNNAEEEEYQTTRTYTKRQKQESYTTQYELLLEERRKSALELEKDLGINHVLADRLCCQGYDSIAKIENASDDQLLNIYTIGPTRLRDLRKKVNAYEKHNARQSE